MLLLPLSMQAGEFLAQFSHTAAFAEYLLGKHLMDLSLQVGVSWNWGVATWLWNCCCVYMQVCVWFLRLWQVRRIEPKWQPPTNQSAILLCLTVLNSRQRLQTNPVRCHLS